MPDVIYTVLRRQLALDGIRQHLFLMATGPSSLLRQLNHSRNNGRAIQK